MAGRKKGQKDLDLREVKSEAVSVKLAASLCV
jgi:hypothetical protein